MDKRNVIIKSIDGEHKPENSQQICVYWKNLDYTDFILYATFDERAYDKYIEQTQIYYPEEDLF